MPANLLVHLSTSAHHYPSSLNWAYRLLFAQIWSASGTGKFFQWWHLKDDKGWHWISSWSETAYSHLEKGHKVCAVSAVKRKQKGDLWARKLGKKLQKKGYITSVRVGSRETRKKGYDCTGGFRGNGDRKRRSMCTRAQNNGGATKQVYFEQTCMVLTFERSQAKHDGKRRPMWV